MPSLATLVPQKAFVCCFFFFFVVVARVYLRALGVLGKYTTIYLYLLHLQMFFGVSKTTRMMILIPRTLMVDLYTHSDTHRANK